MPEQIEPTAAVAGDGLATVNVELGPLTVELGLSDVVAIGKLAEVGQPLAEHGRDEGEHDYSSYSEAERQSGRRIPRTYYCYQREPCVKHPIDTPPHYAQKCPPMNEDLLGLVRLKIQDGRLPRGRVVQVWEAPSDGQACDICGEPVDRSQKVFWGIAAQDLMSIQFHTERFEIWEIERLGTTQAPKR